MMATELKKSDDPMQIRRELEEQTTEKPKDYQELALFLALIAMVGWVSFDGLRTLDWPAISHTFKALLAIVR